MRELFESEPLAKERSARNLYVWITIQWANAHNYCVNSSRPHRVGGRDPSQARLMSIALVISKRGAIVPSMQTWPGDTSMGRGIEVKQLVRELIAQCQFIARRTLPALPVQGIKVAPIVTINGYQLDMTDQVVRLVLDFNALSAKQRAAFARAVAAQASHARPPIEGD
jgi:hypothetical protein